MSQANADWGKRPTTKKAAEASSVAEIDRLVTGDVKPKTSRLNVEMLDELKVGFKSRCALKKLDMAEVVTRLVEGWMKENS